MFIRKKWIMGAIVFAWCSSTLVHAGILDKTDFSGSMGIYLEDYRRFGAAGRRPPHTARLYLRPTLTFLGMSTGVNIDLFLNTEQQYLEQRVNKIGINPTWSWGGFSLGDFYPTMSEMTLSGIRVRGAGGKFNPGLFRFSTAVGETQRASTGGRFDTYQRLLAAFSIGIGREGKSHLDLNILRAMERAGSLPENPNRQVTPQDNLVTSLSGKMSAWQNRILLSGEIAATLFTKDKRSAELNLSYYPSFARKIYNPKLSTNLDYAYFTEARLNMPTFSLGAGYRYIGPGYRSLGLYSLLNDLKGISSDGTLRMLKNRLILRSAYSTQWDNLVGQKKTSTRRQRFSANVTARPFNALNTNLGFMATDMENRVKSDTLRTRYSLDSLLVNFSSISSTFSASYRFPQHLPVRSVQFTGSAMYSRNTNRFLSNQRLKNYRISSSVQFNTVYSILLTPGISVIRSQLGFAPWRWIKSYMLSIYRYGGGKLTPSLSSSINDGSGEISYRVDMKVDYLLTKQGTITLNFRAVNYVSEILYVRSYKEIVTSLSYNQRF